MKWTSEQQQVIEDRGRNMLVSAAAGSGKTAVLTERIIRLLLEGYSLEDFLIITFTKASAKDMKEKIRRAMALNPTLRREEKKLSTAQISTIDSFCHTIVRDHFFYLDIDPAFRIGNENEIAILQDDEMTEMFEELYEAANPGFMDLEAVFGSDKSDLGLRETILRLDAYLSNQIDRDEAIRDILDGYQDQAYWTKRVEEYINRRHEIMADIIEEAKERCFNEKTCALIDDDWNVILRNGKDFPRYPVLSKQEKTDPNAVDANEELKRIRANYTKIAKDLAKELADQGDISEMMARYTAQLPRMQELLWLTNNFHERFFAKRKELNLLSFADVEALALQAVRNPDIAKIYRDRFRFIFIDEYQDTNPIQEGLIQAIRRSDNVFMVGDIKQSIYRFRQADPTIFLGKFHEYAVTSDQAVRIDLNRNFRSAPPIISGVNRIFERIMLADYGGIAYDERSALVFGHTGLTNVTDEVELLITERKDEREQEELRTIIQRIQQLRREGYRYRDMVILMRAPSRFADSAIREFKAAQLPLMLDYSSAYLKSLEVEILLNYLRLVDNFRQDIPLLSLLRLPRYGLNDQDLLNIRMLTPKGAFHEAIMNEDLADELKRKIESFLNDIETFRRHSRSLSIDALLQDIYQATAYEVFILLMPDGKQRLANIRLLFRLAGEYEETSFVGLSKFLRYVERVMQVDKDIEAARIIPEDADTVRLMSIHKSKGLQFPIVFVAGLQRRFNEMDLNQRLMIADHKAVMNEVDLERRTSRVPLFKRLLQSDLREASRQEEIRLLYVAMTRAEKRLILSAVVPDLDAMVASICPHTGNSLRDCNNFWDLIKGTMIIEPDGRVATGYRLIPGDQLELVEPTPRAPRVTASGRRIVPREIPIRRADSKYSVSQLVRQEETLPMLRYGFEEELIGGVEKGILFHKAMQWLDFDNLEASLTELAERGVLTDFEDRALIDRFIHDDLMQDYLRQATAIKRELPFVVRAVLDGEDTLVQGIIDLLIQLPQGDILIDYKTDVTMNYLERYQLQVNYYAEAYQRISGRSVLRKLIWFVRLGRFVEIV